MSSTYYRASFTLPKDLAVQLSDVAKLVGSSQSLVLSVLLADLLPLMALGLQALGPDVSGIARRANGQHRDVVHEVVRDALAEGRHLGRQRSLGLL